MIELHIKVEPELLREFKDISRDLFQGDDSVTFQQAMQLLRLARGGDHNERFWEMADQIRHKVEKAGGISETEIEHLVSQVRTHRQDSAS